MAEGDANMGWRTAGSAVALTQVRGIYDETDASGRRALGGLDCHRGPSPNGRRVRLMIRRRVSRRLRCAVLNCSTALRDRPAGRR